MLKRKSRFAMIVAILLMLTFAVETSLASAATLSQILQQHQEQTAGAE